MASHSSEAFAVYTLLCLASGRIVISARSFFDSVGVQLQPMLYQKCKASVGSPCHLIGRETESHHSD